MAVPGPVAQGEHPPRARGHPRPGRARPDARSAALIGLLLAVNRLHRTVSHPDASARSVKQRAKEVAEENWATPTIKDAVAVATAATAAAHSTAVNGE